MWDRTWAKGRDRRGCVYPCKQSFRAVLIACPHYQSGCHKSCEAWRQLQERQRVQRQQKKAYLDYYNDLCLTMTRQFRALSPCRMIR